MTTKFLKKNIAIFLSVALVLCIFGSFSALAAYPISLTFSAPDSVTQNGVYAGGVITPSVSLDFDEYFITETRAIISVQFGLKFDPQKLTPIDVISRTPLTFDENGAALDGLPYAFGEIANESRFTCLLKNNNTLLCTYLSSTDISHNIMQSGLFAKFAFKISDELTIDGATPTTLELTQPHVGVLSKDADITLSSNNISFRILPPVSPSILGETIIGGSATVVGQKFIDQNGSSPLTMTITKDGEEVEPARNISLSGISLNEKITFDEEIYTPGAYVVTFTYKNMTVRTYMQVKAKPEPLPTVEPTPTPSAEPEPTEEPTPTVTPTAEPTETPAPTVKPTLAPTPTAKPTSTPTPTVKPTAPPTAKPSTGSSRPVATSTPAPSGEDKEEETVATPTPTVTDKEDGREEASGAAQYPSDIDGHWAGNSVRYVYDNSLMNGYADGTFGPDNKITRAEFATVMARFLGLADAPDKATHFDDCDNHWAIGYIGALVDKGIVNGVSDTLFAPDSTVTREQIALILSRTLALTPVQPEEKYADDAQISSWAYDGVYSIFAAGIMKGDTNGNFSPLAGATRAEVATILYRLHNKEK